MEGSVLLVEWLVQYLPVLNSEFGIWNLDLEKGVSALCCVCLCVHHEV